MIENKRICYDNNGTMAIIIPAKNNPALDDLTEQEQIDYIIQNEQGYDPATEYTALDDNDVPTDTYFRHAWKLNGAKTSIEVDMPTAQTIHMDKIRVARDAKMVDLDRELEIATRDDDTVEMANVDAAKQVLLDIPQTFDLTGAATPDALKALWPTELA